ncbi:MAG: hypothetical protein WC505_07225 [Patescibacteria group bacterium]
MLMKRFTTATTGYLYGMLAANLTGVGTDVHVSVTNGSTAVTGTNTSFVSDNVGDLIQLGGDSKWYRIRTVTNATTIVLEDKFAGPTDADTNFSLKLKGIYIKKIALLAENDGATITILDGGASGTTKWALGDIASGVGGDFRYVEADFSNDPIPCATDCYVTVTGTLAVAYVGYQLI